MTNIGVFGSTGSIGKTTLSIVSSYPEQFKVKVLTAGHNIKLFKQQLIRFTPEYASVWEEKDALTLRREFPKIAFFWGQEGLNNLAQLNNLDLIVMAIVGLNALLPTYIGLKHKKKIALASKEVMVVAGEKIKEIEKSDELIIPIDSEHSAIYQLLHNEARSALHKVILTASGGPFLTVEAKHLKDITPYEALKHPKWKMGKKITIDSATMMNKGFEMIEAKWLFNLNPDQIDVIIHPESIIHSMIELKDGAVLAQMGSPDMKLPIAYAMNMRERLFTGITKLDFKKIKVLHFIKPDLKKFRCLKIAMDVIRRTDNSAVVMNAADDFAVDAFLHKKIEFTDIPKIVEYAVERFSYKKVSSVEDILSIDEEVKRKIQERIKRWY